MTTYYKLDKEELEKMVSKKAVSQKAVEEIIEISKLRKVSEFANQKVSFALVKSGKVRLNSINFYGGEHFGEPYHFLAEITGTPRSVNAFLRKYGIKTSVFSY